MDRRELLVSAGAMAAAAVVQGARADEDHSQHPHHHTEPANKTILASAADCVRTGQLCSNHCLEAFGEGDKSLAACARSVAELIPVCETLQQLAALNSKNLLHYARVAMDVCKQCEDECRKHEKEHQTCKDCADACAACAKECQKIAT